MKKTVFLLFALCLILVQPVEASTDEAPAILMNGLEQYAKEGPKTAIEVWTKGSALEGTKEALSRANRLTQAQDFYGKYIGYNMVKINEMTANSLVALVEIKYERGSLYSKFFHYKQPDGQWLITNFSFHTNADAVWPNELVYGVLK